MSGWADLFVNLSVPLFWLAAVAAVVFLLVRPLFRLLFGTHKTKKKGAPRQSSGQHEDKGDSMRPPALSDQEKIKRLAESNPDKAKELIRRWLREEEP